MFQVTLSDRARRFFDKADAGLQRRLDRCFEQLAVNPRRHPNIKRLTADFAGLWRYRVGEYRILYRIVDDQHIVVIVVISHRKDVYE